MNLFLLGRNADKTERTKQDVATAFQRINNNVNAYYTLNLTAIPNVDITKEADLEAAFKQCISKNEGKRNPHEFDLVVCNAGVAEHQLFHNQELMAKLTSQFTGFSHFSFFCLFFPFKKN